jgi:hypothetical protein
MEDDKLHAAKLMQYWAWKMCDIMMTDSRLSFLFRWSRFSLAASNNIYFFFSVKYTKIAISLLISSWQIIHISFSCSSKYDSEEMKQTRKWEKSRKREREKETFSFFLSIFFHHSPFPSYGLRDFNISQTLVSSLSVLFGHDWTSRIILSLIDQSPGK